jgi:hypothetical protein
MAGGLAALDLLGKGVKAGAKALDYQIPKNFEPFLTPVSSTKDFLTNKIETALNLPKDSIAAATDPKGFLSNVIKDVAKEKIVESMGERREIPEEDRSFSSTDNSDFDSLNREYSGFGGGGGKSYFDTEGMSTSSYKRGGKVKSATKPKVNTASRRGDGIAQRGKTRGRYL